MVHVKKDIQFRSSNCLALIFGIELPSSVVLAIIETAPAIKGATASGRTKTARLVTGIEVQVPEYLEVDELIKVNTETGKYMSRV